jgi:transposase-like protein
MSPPLITKKRGVEVLIMGYSTEMKDAVVKKVLVGEKLNYEIAKEAGISRSTLCKWVKFYRRDGKITLNNKEKRPQDWSSEDRIDALIETGSMLDEERVSWCRKNGIFRHHLELWKKDAITATTPNLGKGKCEENRRLKKENKSLKKDLLRKDKALAETAALLVLKKKADFIWGDQEDD